MSSSKTTNYQLHLWEPEDDFLRTEFNENNEKVDAALGAVAVLAASGLKAQTGSYTGNGNSSCTIMFPFSPIMVFVVGDFQSTSTVVLIRNQTAGEMEGMGSGQYSVSWSENSVTMIAKTPTSSEAVCNGSGLTYRYVGIG